MVESSSPQQHEEGRTLKPASAGRVRSGLSVAVLLVLATGMVGLAARVASLSGGMVTGPKGASLKELYEEQHTATIPLPCRRGNILDCRGRLLAGSVQLASVFADPGIVQDVEKTAADLENILNIPAGKISEEINKRKSRRFTWIARHVSDEQAEAIHKLRLAGIGTIREPARIYPMGGVAAHVLGFVGTEQKGLAGLELEYDSYLRGEDGYKIVTKSAGGKILGLAPNGYRAPRDGCNIVLSLDAYIQSEAEKCLAETINTYQAPSGVVVVTEVSTGQVLAMASWPTFDPNHFRTAPRDAFLNRALVGPVEPGSVFKPLVFSIAMQEGSVRPGEIFDCHNGVYVRGSRRLRDSHPYGNLTAEEVVSKSSNIGMAQIGERLGNQAMHHYLSQFGIGSKTGIDLTGEDVGILLPLKRWTSFSTDSIPMGQEVAVTAMQLIMAFDAVIDGGTLMRPRLMRAVLAPDGSVIVDHRKPDIVRRVIDESVSNYMRQGPLKLVINAGTGRRARLERWQVVGKTGTAQIAKRGGGGYESGAYVASFICAAPADDPQVSVLVMIHRPKRSIAYYGGTVSAPPAAEILGTTLDYLGVPDDPVRPPVNGNLLVRNDD